MIADTIVGSKTDLYSTEDKQALMDYGNDQARKPEDIIFIEHGQLPISLLAGKTQYCKAQASSLIKQAKVQPHKFKASLLLNKKTTNNTTLNEKPFPESGVIKAINKGEGFQSIGWRFAADKTFNRAKLNSFIASLNVTRLKAVFITNEGNFAYNLTGKEGNIANNEVKLTECNESRIEIICSEIDKAWEEELLNCLNQ